MATRSPCQIVVRTVLAESAPPHFGHDAPDASGCSLMNWVGIEDTERFCVAPLRSASFASSASSTLFYPRIIWIAASMIFGASGRSQPIIPAAPGPGTSGNASFFALTPGTACTTSAMMCDP